MVRKWIFLGFFVLMSVLAIPTSVFADGIIIPEPPFPQPLPIAQLDIRYHHVQVTIEDQIAITRVDQVFHNPNDWTVEGIYIFPVPLDAVVSNFKLWIDGQPVEGKVLSAEEAQQTYEEIVRKLVDPALLEYVGQSAVQARIFPIEPGNDRRIELEYTQVLVSDNGLVRYNYPLNTEKFSRSPLDEVSVSVNIQSSVPIRAIYSPSHNVGISRDGNYRVAVGYEEKNITPDSDFVLYYSLGETEAFHLLSYKNSNDPTDPDGFYLLLLAPRPDASDQVIPKDVIIVLDQSGSMEGEKYRQAQDAAVFILEHLNRDDHFNVITFSTGLQSFANRLQTIDAVQNATEWVRASAPAGSTDINRALLESLSVANNERPTFILFLTDGLPTAGEIDTQHILDNFRQAATNNIRLFSFGVGYDVDTILLDSLAQEHHGTTTYVVPGERIDETVSSFYQKVSTPVLTDLELDFENIPVFDNYPDPLPDLFIGSQIVAVGRYREGGEGNITLSGVIDGQRQQFVFPNQIFAQDSQEQGDVFEALPRLWATRKIGYLLNHVRINGPDQETIDQIVKLSIRYGIVTPYTSYLVTEPMALGVEAQERIAEGAFNDMVQSPAPAVSGQEAVEKAADQGYMAEAEVVEAPPVEIANQVRIIGARTYIFSNNIWIDTAFDPEKMETAKIPFLSNEYFSLLNARPELGDAFSLGNRVIVFSDGIAYEVVEENEHVDPIDIPEPKPTRSPEIAGPVATTIVELPPIPKNPSQDSEKQPTTSFPCLGGLLPLLIFPIFGLVRIRKNKPK